MAEKRSLELILHNEVQLLLDNFASAMRVHVVFFGRGMKHFGGTLATR